MESPIATPLTTTKHPHFRWLDARKSIADRVCDSVAELRRIAPWASVQWERVRTEEMAVRMHNSIRYC
jgi:hypothetical protein